MKRILLILTLLSTLTASAQFPNRDSLQRYINRWIRNSAVDAFTNLRLNTAMNGLIGEIKEIGIANSGIASVTKIGDSLKITTTAGDVFAVYLPSGGGGTTNLSVSRTTTNINVQSSTGTTGIIPPATQLLAGSLSAADKIKLDSAIFTAQLRDSINTRVRLLYKRGDSVFINRGVGEVFSYKDSAGGAGTGSVTSVGSGYGLTGGPITTAGTLVVDSATLSLKWLRRADSALYTTRTRLATDLAGKLSNISGLITPGSGVSISGSGTIGSPYVINSSSTGGTVTSVGSGYGLTGGPITGAGTLVVDTTTLSGKYIRRADSSLYATRTYVNTTADAFKFLKQILIPSRMEFVSLSSTTTYTDTLLIGSQIMTLAIEGYQVSTLERTGVIWFDFDTETGTITLHNGVFALDDAVIIVYRTLPVFLYDGGIPVKDSNGNYIILN